MIQIKTTVEITETLLRKDLKPELQKMSLKELRNFKGAIIYLMIAPLVF